MEAPNLGPDWLWTLLLIAAVIGIVSVIITLVNGIIWLVQHVHLS